MSLPKNILDEARKRNEELITLACRAAIDETSLDLGGILHFDHIYLIVGDRKVAETFYFEFLGLTPQPGASFHCNLGQVGKVWGEVQGLGWGLSLGFKFFGLETAFLLSC